MREITTHKVNGWLHANLTIHGLIAEAATAGEVGGGVPRFYMPIEV